MAKRVVPIVLSNEMRAKHPNRLFCLAQYRTLLRLRSKLYAFLHSIRQT